MNHRQSFTVEEAKTRMEAYCAYQERCHKEVRNKLREMRMIPEARDLILVHLIEKNFLNEQRFAEQFTLGKFRIKKWGRNRIKRELKFREISNYSIQKAMDLIPQEAYVQTLDELTDKRIAAVSDSNPLRRKKKICDYLLYRGWESHLVYDIVHEKLNKE